MDHCTRFFCSVYQLVNFRVLGRVGRGFGRLPIFSNNLAPLVTWHLWVADFIATSGHPAWSFLTISGAGNCDAWGLKTLWMQEIIERGVLCLGTHNMTYAHSEDDIARLIVVYDEVFPILKAAVENDGLQLYLRCEPLVPLFKLR